MPCPQVPRPSSCAHNQFCLVQLPTFCTSKHLNLLSCLFSLVPTFNVPTTSIEPNEVEEPAVPGAKRQDLEREVDRFLELVEEPEDTLRSGKASWVVFVFGVETCVV